MPEPVWTQHLHNSSHFLAYVLWASMSSPASKPPFWTKAALYRSLVRKQLCQECWSYLWSICKKNCQHAILASHSSKGGTARSSGSWMPWNRWWNAAQASDWLDMIWVADIVLALTILCLLYSPCHLAGLIPNEWPASLLSLVFTSSSAMWSSGRSGKLTSQLSQY